MRTPSASLASIAPLLAAVSFALFGLLGCNQGQGSTSPDLPSFQDLTTAPAPIQKAAEAVVRIRTANEVATGSFISPTGLLLTNNHVLGTEICPVEGCFAQITFDFQRGKPSSAATPTTVFVIPSAVSVGLDMAVVQVFTSKGGGMLSTPSFLTIEAHGAAELLKTHVTLVGHPEGHLKKWTDGEVVDSNGHWIWTSAYLLPGNSGSPILDDAGNVVGIVHRGPTGEDYFTSDGALTYSIGTDSAALQASMSAPLPPEMISVGAATTADDVVAHDIVYLNAHVSSAMDTDTTKGPLDVLSALGTACDAALKVTDYPTPEALATALQPCQDAMSWIECRTDAQTPSSGAVCPGPMDVTLWQQRFAAMNAAYVALNGETLLTPVSFGIASLQPSKAAGTSAGASSLQQALSQASQPLDLNVANYLAAFSVASYQGTQTVSYVTGYASVPDYALYATDAASAAAWMLDNGMMTRDNGLQILAQLYADGSVDVGSKLYIEDFEYQSGVLQ